MLRSRCLASAFVLVAPFIGLASTLAAESTPASPRRGAALRPWQQYDDAWLSPPYAPPRDVHRHEVASALATQYLGPDGRANDRNPLTCTLCQGLPLIQTEAGIAVLGSNVLASWNEGERMCPSPSRQNYGWSTDGGLTFTDAGSFPLSSNGGGRLFGDATVAVNARTGRFYIAGLISATSLPGGVGMARGSFGPGGFVLEDSRRIASPLAGNPFLDKPWMVVDSSTSNVYVSWTNTRFPQRIEFLRLDADLNPLGPVQVLSDTCCSAQWSQPVPGPDGELWVHWTTQRSATDFQRVLLMRRSTDHGASFGPVIEVMDDPVNTLNGGAGFLRGLAATQPHIVRDMSHGPHRGRAYLSYDGCVDYEHATLPDVSLFEVEPNGTPATATPLVPGGKLRGEKTGNEEDWFRIELDAGETFYLEAVYWPNFEGDSSTVGVAERLWCPGTDGVLRSVTRGPATSGGVLWTAPFTGTFYLQLLDAGNEVGTYVFKTAILTPQPGEAARDHRDQLLKWSDDGVSWSAPVRLNDSAPGADGQYPTVGVDGRGRVHVFWMDFREDPCGLLTTQVMTSSGDGGVTWGAPRRITEGVSSWAGPFCNELNGNTQGDYQTIATDGDIVVAAFNDARQGDPDIFVDVSIHRAVTACAPEGTIMAGPDTLVSFSWTNGGNYDRPLSWRVEDSAGWITAVSPAPTGSETVAIGGHRALSAMLLAPDCDPDSSIVRWITWDPAIPGYEDTCVTVVRCRDGVTSVAVSLASVDAGPDRVILMWSAGEDGWAAERVWRRTVGSEWSALGVPEVESRGWRFEDRTVAAGTRYAYRLELRGPEGTEYGGQSWVDVPAAATFAISGLSPNPTGGELEVRFSLPEAGAARLELYDVAGRRLVTRDVGDLGPGWHRVRIAEQGDLAAGIYTVRLVQGSRRTSVRAVVVR